MEVASLELSKQLFEVSGWETGTTGFTYHDNSIVFGWVEGGTPAYTLGILLRGLPTYCKVFQAQDGMWAIEYKRRNDYPIRTEVASNPEEAAAKLCIALFEAGILTREGEDDG